jgi:hypothetical protein
VKMNLIEALKEANGKLVSRKTITKGSTIQEVDGAIVWNDVAIGKCESFRADAFLADDWYVVEPKSKIEEAREREVQIYVDGGSLRSSMNRLINVALEEAVRVAVEHSEHPKNVSIVIDIRKLQVEE